MIRQAALAICCVLLGGAGPQKHTHTITHAAVHAVAPPLPLPPPLPDDPPRDEPAPVPNVELRAPGVVISDHTEFGFHVFRMHEFGTNDSVVPGSTYQSPEQRKPLQPPGLLVTVPLH